MFALAGLTAVLLGAVVGSFLNVVIHRVPRGGSVIRPGSHCPRCQTPIRPIHLVPIVSWIALRARCAHCSAPISPRYPWVEALGALLALLSFQRFVPDAAHLSAATLAASAVVFAFLANLVAASLIDVRHRILPDECTVWAVPAGIGAQALLEYLGVNAHGVVGWRMAVLGAAAGFIGLGAIAAAGKWLSGREALGWGDVKLLAAIGAWCGPVPGLVVATFTGSVIGSVAGLGALVITRRRTYLPYGPSLAVGAAIWLLYGDRVTPWLLPSFAP